MKIRLKLHARSCFRKRQLGVPSDCFLCAAESGKGRFQEDTTFELAPKDDAASKQHNGVYSWHAERAIALKLLTSLHMRHRLHISAIRKRATVINALQSFLLLLERIGCC